MSSAMSDGTAFVEERGGRRRAKRGLSAAVLLLASLGAVAVVSHARARVKSADRLSRLSGMPVPRSLFRTSAGGWVDLSRETDGRTSLIAFLRPGCSPCESERRVLEDLAELHGEWKLIVVEEPYGSSETRSTHDRSALLTLQDERNEFGRVFGGTNLPMLLLVGSDGRVRHAAAGERSARSLEQQLARMSSGLE